VRLVENLVRSPFLYVGWLLIVLVAMVVSYLGDPFIFGATWLIAGYLSIPIGLLGVLVARFSRTANRRAKTVIVISGGLLLVAFAIAAAILRTFNWA
jgi:hypothetical protein